MDDRVVFTTAQARQIRSVLRLSTGDLVRVFDGQADSDLVVELVASGSEALVGEVVGTTPYAREPSTPVAVYPALLQRDKFEQVLQKLVEVGASSITPVVTERSLVRQPPDDRRLERWHAIMQEAAEQSGRGMVPALRPALPLRTALEAAAAAGTTLLAFEGASAAPLAHCLSAADLPIGEVSLFVGPEGGFADNEVEHARGWGARIVSLGPRILRAETAAPVFAALVQFLLDPSHLAVPPHAPPPVGYDRSPPGLKSSK